MPSESVHEPNSTSEVVINVIFLIRDILVTSPDGLVPAKYSFNKRDILDTGYSCN